MEWLASGDYQLVRFLFHRALAVVYLLAFLVAAFQFRPLAGEDGLLPLARYVEGAEFRERPSLFYVFPSDRAVGAAAWTGVALAAVAVLAGPSWLPRPYAVPASMALWAGMWVLYLSFVNAGQTFYGYGWESMLLETGFLAVFLGAGSAATPVVVVWLLRWVLFRNMFGAGLIKLRGDDCWRDLTALDYHYETQPIPNPVSWFAHHLPDRVHRAETYGNHVAEVVVPFLYFAPQPYASLAGGATVLFQGWLMVTGNFAWLNALTLVLAIAAFSDGALATVLPVDATLDALPVGAAGAAAGATLPLYLGGAALLVTAVVLALSLRPARNLLAERQVMNTAFDPLHLVNTYGAFGSVTRQRHELVVQGTNEETVDEDTEWRTYEFKGKPTDPERRPRQVAPYHLRLDWQLWFAAMSPTPRRHPWVPQFVAKLLAGDEATTGLLASNPFPGEPPEHVRILRYRYRFTTPDEREATGRWWHRERVGTYVRPVSLDELRTAERPRRGR